MEKKKGKVREDEEGSEDKSHSIINGYGLLI